MWSMMMEGDVREEVEIAGGMSAGKTEVSSGGDGSGGVESKAGEEEAESGSGLQLDERASFRAVRCPVYRGGGTREAMGADVTLMVLMGVVGMCEECARRRVSNVDWMECKMLAGRSRSCELSSEWRRETRRRLAGLEGDGVEEAERYGRFRGSRKRRGVELEAVLEWLQHHPTREQIERERKRCKHRSESEREAKEKE